MKQNSSNSGQKNTANRSGNIQPAQSSAKPSANYSAKRNMTPSLTTSSNTDDVTAINELAKKATPKQIRAWINRLEDLYEQKKSAVRKDLTSKVGDLLESNGYTIEELFAARQLPTTADLAARAKTRKDGKTRPTKYGAR